MIDFNSGQAETRLNIPTVVDFDAAARKLAKEQPKRNYLGGSRLGEECLRKLQYEYLGETANREMTAKTHMVFAFGHAGEDAVADLLRAMGFNLSTHKPDGFQHGFSAAGGKLRGHIDGVLLDGPERFGPYPKLWENKWVGSKYWNLIVKNGVCSERPTYAAQVAIYQAYMQLDKNPALFTTGNRDTGELWAEWVPFNAKLAQTASDRGVTVIRATDVGETLPRNAVDADAFSCKFCDYRQTCWRL